MSIIGVIASSYGALLFYGELRTDGYFLPFVILLSTCIASSIFLLYKAYSTASELKFRSVYLCLDEKGLSLKGKRKVFWQSVKGVSVVKYTQNHVVSNKMRLKRYDGSKIEIPIDGLEFDREQLLDSVGVAIMRYGRRSG